LRRLSAYSASLGSDNNSEALEASGVPSDLIEGMILAKDHYGAFDPESYRVGVLQGLSMALNSNGEIETMMASSESTRSDSDLDNPASSVSVAEKPKLEPQGDVEDLILNVVRNSSDVNGIPYDSIVLACTEAGFSRESSEDAIEDLRDIKCQIIEPRFGFFQILD
jgi:hypothetical protein